MTNKAKTVAKGFTSWSFSRWQDYERCPAFAKYKHLERRPTVAGPAAARGTEVHSLAESYLQGKLKYLPTELDSLRKAYAALRRQGDALIMEQMWGHDRAWRPVDPTAWDVCWLRVKMDVVYLTNRDRVLNVDDHKTGRIKPDAHQLQLELYAASALHRYARVDVVRGRMLYTDHGKITKHVVRRKDLPALTEKFERAVEPMFADRRFSPRPGAYCRWCDFSKGKGGPCPY